MLSATRLSAYFMQDDAVETALNDLNKKYRYMEVRLDCTFNKLRRYVYLNWFIISGVEQELERRLAEDY